MHTEVAVVWWWWTSLWKQCHTELLERSSEFEGVGIQRLDVPDTKAHKKCILTKAIHLKIIILIRFRLLSGLYFEVLNTRNMCGGI